MYLYTDWKKVSPLLATIECNVLHSMSPVAFHYTTRDHPMVVGNLLAHGQKKKEPLMQQMVLHKNK